MSDDIGVGPERRTYAEALGDADLDLMLYGSVCVIRNGNGMFQRISPLLVSVRPVGDGYSIVSCGHRPIGAPSHDWSECNLPSGHQGPHAFVERGTQPAVPPPFFRPIVRGRARGRSRRRRA